MSITIISQKISALKSFLSSAGYEEKQHQIDGVEWCIKKELDIIPPVNETRSGIIADEMGLGKTIIMLGLIISNFVPKTLIVLPLALIEQWETIMIERCGHAPFVWHGTNKNLDRLESAPVVLTTYGLITPKKAGGKTPLHGIKWDRIIYDEAHHLRNMETSVHEGAKTLTGRARWLITGTPIQNRFSDFYALCAAMGMKPNYYVKQENIPTIAKHCIMKRTKASVGVKLPELTCETISVPWANEEERMLAQDIHSLLSFSNVSERNVDNVIAGMDNEVLALLIRARQLCVYPALLEKHVNKMTQMGLLESATKCASAISHSSKLDAVCDHIRKRDKARSKLVFCHYRGEIDELARRLSDSFDVKTFDGRTTANQRKEALEEACDILILQIQTGCEGLNLQQFKEVYFVSPNWNPAVEDQAVARCHRIGQTEPISVFKFDMTGFDDDDTVVDSESIDGYSTSVQDVKRKIVHQFEEDCQEERDTDLVEN
jgi:SNF2 family DNA or RNA helicase